MHRYFLMAAIIASAAGCGSDSTSSKVFTDAKAITVINPQACKPFFIDDNGEGETIDFGTSATELGLNDIRVFAAIFDDYPQVDRQSGKVVNPENAIWIWHSGMRSKTSATTGHLRFSDGVQTDKAGNPSGLVACGSQPAGSTCSAFVATLDRVRGKNYYFLMWAWNGDRNISYFSDEAIEFCITNTKGDAEPCKKACP
jgi:hypothetical protein